jgi:LmbE family N-acetylglucosaminyl deacetylase
MPDLMRILVITAHPDDVDYGAGGTVGIWADEGAEITYGILTNGDAGGFDPLVPREDIPGIRQREQRAAASILGVQDVHFLGYPDGDLQVSHEVRKDISRLIRLVRPQRMLIQSPERNWQRLPASHPDHLAAGEASIRAIYPDARNPFAYPELMAEGLTDWIVPEVWVMGAPHTNHVVDITDVFDRKVAAISAHESQVAHIPDLASRVREWNNAIAREHDLGDQRVAEEFLVTHLS